MSDKSVKLEKRWEEYDKLFRSYSSHIQNIKRLTFYELLLVKNFKGGSAVFPETIDIIENKLVSYFEKIQEYKVGINNEKGLIKDLFHLIDNKNTKIKGFSFSFLSAMLAMFFPDNFPIMDWRVLLATEIIVFDKNKKKFIYRNNNESKNINYLMDKFPLELYLDLFNIINKESDGAKGGIRRCDKYYFSHSEDNLIYNF